MKKTPMTLRECISETEKDKKAIGHFNISNIEMLWGIFHAAKELDLPIIIGVSEGERQYVGVRQCVALIQSIREDHGYPIYLNADHTYSVEKVKEAIDAGFDAVIYDGAKLSIEENIKNTQECVAYARTVSMKTGRDVLVEAELGYIGQSSKVLDAIPEGVDLKAGLTTPEMAKNFVTKTGVDLFAPAVGNIHGMMRVGKDPRLEIDLVKQIREACGVPLVLHGGSGTVDEDFVHAIYAGISIVHISTELRVAFRKALSISLQENPDEVAPYKYGKDAVQAVSKVVSERLKLFNSIK